MNTTHIPSGIQKHSQGPLFPAVIARVEKYSPGDRIRIQDPIECRRVWTCYRLILGNLDEKYPTYEEAEQQARNYLAVVNLSNASRPDL